MKLTTVLLLFLFCLPLLVGLNASSLWDSNEAFYAQTPREMLQRGDWLIPYFNGRPRLNKPPLAYWVVGAFYRVFGVSVFWERFPMALLSIGTLLTTFALGRFLFNETAALLGAGVLATSFRFLILSRRLMIDILLLLCLTAALAFFLIWLKSGRRWAFLGTALALGLGFLTKGPVIGVAVLSILAIVLVQGKFKQLRGAPWTAAVMLIVLLVPAWFLLVAAEVGWDPVGAFFLRENLGRFSPPRFRAPARCFLLSWCHFGRFLSLVAVGTGESLHLAQAQKEGLAGSARDRVVGVGWRLVGCILFVPQQTGILHSSHLPRTGSLAWLPGAAGSYQPLVVGFGRNSTVSDRVGNRTVGDRSIF